VSYDTPYAARLHEHPEYNFQNGRQGKYLEEPAMQNRAELDQQGGVLPLGSPVHYWAEAEDGCYIPLKADAARDRRNRAILAEMVRNLGIGGEDV